MNGGFKQKIPTALIESVEEDLPTPDEIEKFAEKGTLPEKCTDSRSEYITKINDVYGHQAGDNVLKEISAEFMQNLRSADFAARYGGEELVALLPHTDLDSARTVAEKIRGAVNDRFKDDLQVTVSIGVACWQERMNKPADLVRTADVALYKAKETGKNRVIAVPSHRYNP